MRLYKEIVIHDWSCTCECEWFSGIDTGELGGFVIDWNTYVV